MSKGIKLTPLLNSKVFFFTFDYDEWPSTHTNKQRVIRPYSHSIFSIRQHYLTTFPEISFERPSEEDQSKTDTSKIYKLNYTINLLPLVTSHLQMRANKDKDIVETWVNTDYDVLDLLTKTNEWSVFKTKAVKDLIKFKWDAYCFNFHLLGFLNHMVMLGLLVVYDIKVYLNDDLYKWVENKEFDVEKEKLDRNLEQGKMRVRIDEHGNDFAYILLIGVVYSFVYLIFQLKRIGAKKIITQPHKVDPFVWAEIIYIAICILVSLIHQTYDPQDFVAKILMLIQLVFILLKTFKYLRIYELFSPLIQMVMRVLWDLRNFLFMFGVNIMFFSIVLTIL